MRGKLFLAGFYLFEIDSNIRYLWTQDYMD